MSTETGLFWLIHFFIGIVIPVMAFRGCCREREQWEESKITSRWR